MCLLVAGTTAGCGHLPPLTNNSGYCFVESGWFDSSNGCSVRDAYPNCYLVCPRAGTRVRVQDVPYALVRLRRIEILTDGEPLMTDCQSYQRCRDLIPANRLNGYAQWLKGARAATNLVRHSPRHVSRVAIIEQRLARVRKWSEDSKRSQQNANPLSTPHVCRRHCPVDRLCRWRSHCCYCLAAVQLGPDTMTAFEESIM